MKIWIGLLSAALLLVAASAPAEPHAVGDSLPELELPDQRGELRKLDGSVRVAIFTREMGAGRVARQALAEDGAARLDRAGGIYVSDVSRMPALVRRVFALPSLRRRPYPILLDFEGTATARFPSEEGKVTLLTLEGRRITDLRFVATADEVKAALAP